MFPTSTRSSVDIFTLLIVYSPTRKIFYSYADRTIAGVVQHILGLCSPRTAFYSGGIFIVPYLL